MSTELSKQIQSSPSPNFNDRREGKGVTMLVLHYTGMTSASAALDRMCDPASQVSAHYMIDEAGLIYQLVAEGKRTWHAGVSSWRGESDVNSASIGIEIVNPGHEFGYVPYPELQMQAIEALSVDIVKRYKIDPVNVIGHSDIAPLRKQDPGELFDWQRLATKGVGLWVARQSSPITHPSELALLLRDIGYEADNEKQLCAAIKAFQRHWRQSNITGEFDRETADMVYSLSQEVKRLT